MTEKTLAQEEKDQRDREEVSAFINGITKDLKINQIVADYTNPSRVRVIINCLDSQCYIVVDYLIRFATWGCTRFPNSQKLEDQEETEVHVYNGPDFRSMIYFVSVLHPNPIA